MHSSEAVAAADPVAAPVASTESGNATRAPIHNIHTTSIATTTIIAGTIPGHRLGAIRSSLSRTRLPPDGASTCELSGEQPGQADHYSPTGRVSMSELRNLYDIRPSAYGTRLNQAAEAIPESARSRAPPPTNATVISRCWRTRPRLDPSDA